MIFNDLALATFCGFASALPDRLPFTQRGRYLITNCLRGTAKRVVVKMRISLSRRRLRVTQELPDYRQTKAAARAETCISMT